MSSNIRSYPYNLDESTFIFRGIGSDISFLFHFSMKRHIWGYSVCLCPIKKTPGLYGIEFKQILYIPKNRYSFAVIMDVIQLIYAISLVPFLRLDSSFSRSEGKRRSILQI